MVKLERRMGPAGLLMTIIALGLGGCGHDAHRAERQTSYRSLKDDPAPAAKSASASVAVAPAPAAPVPAKAAEMAPASGPRVLPPLRQAAVASTLPSAGSPKLAAAPDQDRTVPAPVRPMAPIVPPSSAPSATVTITSRPSQPPAVAPSASRPQVAPPQVLPSPPEAPLPQVLDAAGIERLLLEGQRLFNQGRVLDARRRFIAAMNGPVPEVLLALARSYDTYYLSRLPAADAAPDMQRALVLYERAVERGAIEANADLERTRNILKVPR